MTFGSLFAGIGGLDLGLERAGMQCVWQVEKDAYATKVLEKHWPNVRRWDDVKTFPPEGDWSCHLICGGFPCQDISIANGNRKGLQGDRSGLWWEFARVVRTLRPRYVLVENTPGLLAPTDDEVQASIGCILGELATIGYDAEWEGIPMWAFGSTQERFRVFILAYAAGDGNRPRMLSKRPHRQKDSDAERCFEFAANHTDAECVISRQRASQVCDQSGERRSSGEPHRCDSPFVGTGWWSAEPPLVRMVYGVPRKLVRDSIRCLGNAVCPQVAEYIGRRLMETLEMPARGVEE